MGGYTFEVSGVDRVRPDWGCGGIAGSCLSGIRVLNPGEKQSEQILLNKRYRFEKPGSYDVVAIRRFPFAWGEGAFTLSEKIDFREYLTIVLVKGEQPELLAAFQPVVEELESEDWYQKQWARLVITELAPTFLEEVVLGLARSDDISAVGFSIKGLKRLNTKRSRQALAELAETASEDGRRQNAIRALARLGDQKYLPLLKRLASGKDRDLQFAAIRAVGELGGEDVISFLLPLLRNADPLIRHDAVFGLANTGSRAVIPVLMEMLQDSEGMVRQSAANALSQLTHRSARLDVRDPARASKASQRWLRWWALNWDKAGAFGPRECGAYQLLD